MKKFSLLTLLLVFTLSFVSCEDDPYVVHSQTVKNGKKIYFMDEAETEDIYAYIEDKVLYANWMTIGEYGPVSSFEEIQGSVHSLDHSAELQDNYGYILVVTKFVNKFYGRKFRFWVHFTDDNKYDILYQEI